MQNEKLVSDITGVILAGGSSKRMGVNKSLLKIDDLTLIEKVNEIMTQVFDKVIISTNEPASYEFIKTEKVTDVIKGFGPLSGIHSSLQYVGTKKIFIVSADMPFLIPPMLKYLIDIQTKESIVLPKAEFCIQYLCGIYSKDILPLAERILMDNQEAAANNKNIKKSAVSLWNFAERVGAEIVDVKDKVFYMKDVFFSVNTPEDWEYAKERII
ncbi:MAG: molybdenum cofactor guanylyltransferase [Bacteroidetes bacterium]|nr:molybdenum cofactor guanylyltransferase [Bacteroidota bacterium]